MENLPQIEEIEQQNDYLAATGAYAGALDLVTAAAHLFPENAQEVVFTWSISLACKLPKALDFVMQEGRFARKT